MDRAISGCGRWMSRRVLGLALCVSVAGCVVNPLTGSRELGFVSMERQISIGEQNYLPAQQMQGGQYRVDPELTEYVRQVGQRVAAESGVDLPYEFVVLNNPVPNAWALPGGKFAINRGLLTELNNEAELAAVLGHEVVHAAGRHGAKAMERSVVSQVALLGVMIAAAQTDYAGTAIGGAQLAAGLLNQKYGRDAEREADFYGTRYLAAAGYDPEAAVTLQETFVRLSGGRGDSSWLDGLFASHPPSEERVANNRSLVRQLRSEGFEGGELGTERYRAALARLEADAPAYEAYDQAREALREKRYDEAETLLAQAIAKQGREAAFHGLRGDLRLSQERHGDALTNYNRAIERDPEFFAYYLGRGVTHARANDGVAAKRDLDRSIELLPTAVAHSELGRLAEAAGDTDGALRHYQAAGQSPSPAGRAAQTSVFRLDVPRNPDQYIDTRLHVDSQGRLILQVVNRTPENLGNIEVRVDAVDGSGRTGSIARTVSQLPPGAARLVLVSEGGVRIADARARVVRAEVSAP